MSTKPDLPDQPWFIRQVHQRTWSDREDDDVLPMRLPPAPPPPETIEPARDADPALSRSASNWFGGYRPFPGYTPLSRDDASAGDGFVSGNRATPDDPGWLDWTPPTMDAVRASTPRRDLRLPLLIGLGVLAVLLAFAAGWAVSAWVKRDVGAVTPVPVVAPRVAVTAPVAPIVHRPVERLREASQPKVSDAKVAKVARPAKVVKPAKVAKPAAKKSTVRKAPAARAKPVIEAKRRVVAPAAKPAPAAIVRAKPARPRESWAGRSFGTDEATSRVNRPEPSPEATVRPNDAESPPATAAPTNLLSAIEPAEETASSPRTIARERTEKQPKAPRRLPRCVGFQISRPNVACRVGGPR
ncbi:hypothetical protein KX816_11445 [Sphingosinicellaceae bacterium]|nr:hypothetical protein KX816_11445 [Sphingosinicellaceae bacterium]